MSFSGTVKKELIEKKSIANADILFLKEEFLKKGTILDPSKSYRMEFRTNVRQEALKIQNIIKKVTKEQINAHMSVRGENIVLYIKVVEDIIALLTCMGATHAAMEIMQVKMFKDVRNYANRTTNFETANLDKTVHASTKQVVAIRKIRDTIGLNSLPNGLKEIAKLRLKYPEISLKALGEYLSKPLSRSGVNHRLTKLMEIADMEEK